MISIPLQNLNEGQRINPITLNAEMEILENSDSNTLEDQESKPGILCCTVNYMGFYCFFSRENLI